MTQNMKHAKQTEAGPPTGHATRLDGLSRAKRATAALKLCCKIHQTYTHEEALYGGGLVLDAWLIGQ